MKKRTGFIWACLFLVAASASEARAQRGRNDADRVCVYEHNNFQGWSECYRIGEEVLDLHSHGNQISSIRVFGTAAVAIYDDKDFGGRSMQVSSDLRDLAQVSGASVLGGQNWNDRIGSFSVVSRNSRAPVPVLPPSRIDPRDDRRSGRRDSLPDSICFYEDTEFRGRVECFDTGRQVQDLGRSGDWSDRVSSIRVIGNGRAAVYFDVGFRGEQLIIDHDISDLKKYRTRDNKNWDNQISSVEVGGSRGGRRF